MRGEESSSEGFSVDQLIILEYYKVLENMMAEIKWRF